MRVQLSELHRSEHCGPRYRRISLLTVMISTELDQLHNAVIKVMEPHKGTGNKAKCEAMTDGYKMRVLTVHQNSTDG